MVKGYEVVIGLETHAELNTESKIYCDCKNQFGLEVNSQVCPICMGMPGTLPTLNEKVVDYAIRMGHALNCEINRVCKQDRKNYFYPDLPKAYQISQAEVPLCGKGYVDILVDGEERRIGITRIHIEEDAGKLLHSDKFHGVSLVDLNRCGVPLIEIVSEPDMRSSQEAKVYLETLKSILQYLGICDCKMQEGSIRCDVNVSVHKPGEPFGTRSEMKNVNSFSAAVRGIDYEVERQITVLEAGGEVEQETRRWDDEKGMSIPMRSKEDAQDYRYFPEPDIPPVFLSDEEIEDIRKSMPEMPQDRFVRYTEKYGLPTDDANLIISSKEFSDFYDESVKINPDYKQISNLMLVELNRNLNDSEKTISDVTFSPADLAELVKMSTDGVVSKNAAKDILKIMFNNGGKPIDIAKENGFIMDNDTSGLEEIIDKIIAENADSVESYKNGNQKIFGFLMGQVVRTAGKGANPKLAKDLLTEKLK